MLSLKSLQPNATYHEDITLIALSNIIIFDKAHYLMFLSEKIFNIQRIIFCCTKYSKNTCKTTLSFSFLKNTQIKEISSQFLFELLIYKTVIQQIRCVTLRFIFELIEKI